jgi:hypothetical protein
MNLTPHINLKPQGNFKMDIEQLTTFGDVRRMILNTIVALRDDRMDVSRGMAIAANFKVLNDNIQVEINAAKMAMATKDEAHNFGRIVNMGQRLIGNGEGQQA